MRQGVANPIHADASLLTRYSLTRDQRISGKARAQMLDMYTI